ncbi:cryptochrome/photolyase family protein [Hyphobacterium sp. HN65]|uniref:Cryptochrome/photolyase family protein n=1 Tax=Hyphobacterium lacteum TaxID=3116575 RepID=A0ABU7LM55_9PROT|nr:cryptochrome/photolyase family protein [Hyphobacterium sp. HN65]MEE2524989.1 cryptochrome/photolyase family protein [Hyphobacterium sp. HN65]
MSGSGRSLRLVLGDQLSPDIASLKDIRADDVVLIAEVMAEARYVRHHKKKIAFLFSAMRHFADELRGRDLTIRYVQLDDAGNCGSLGGEVERALEECGPFDRVIVTEAGEFRLKQEMDSWSGRFELPVEIRSDDRFICTHQRFEDWASGRKRLTMEYFYREMRRETGILMDGDKPVGGQWNYDHDNRKRLPAGTSLPGRIQHKPDDVTQAVLALVGERFAEHFGDLEPFSYAVTREGAEADFAFFLKTCLPQFGDYQDAMAAGEAFLFHSVISMYLNSGLLDARAVCEATEAEFREGRAPINAVEGFIRQILGWREYVRGLYWLKMPDYAETNFLEAHRPLPDFYWDGKTKMACVRDVVTTTRRHAYAHHIQRLMITGNFALLAGIDPKQVEEWYLLVYADAYEWVELPNTHGMALFADGGMMATKPYAASGAYINRMSDYCSQCSYSVSKKNGEKACPFNYLYWNFLIENEDRLKGNQRLAMPYRNLAKMDDEKRAAILQDSRRFFRDIGIA